MELRHLRNFAALAEDRSFTRAAARLHLSQPGLSTQIQALEREVGVTLVDRSNRTVTLTAAGEVLLAEARRVLEGLDDTVELLQRTGRAEVGRLTVGFVPSAATTVLPEAVRRFGAEHPGVVTRLREMTPDDLVHALHDASIDLAMMFRPFDDDSLHTQLLHRERFVLAVPDSHPLSRRRRVAVAALRDEAFVLPARHGRPGLHGRIMEVCGKAGFTPRPVQDDVWMIQTIVGLVAAGAGIALVPESTRALPRAGVHYLDVTPAGETIELVAAWRPGNAAPATLAFLRACPAP